MLPGGPSLPERMVLTLDLREGLEEVAGTDPLAALAVGWQPSLADVVMALDQAGADERVAGLLVRLDGQGPGFAQLQELRDAVQRFRAQGKPAVAHADAFGELGPGNGGYYLASAFERIDLQPVGTLGLTGLILEAPLARGLLDKLGVLPAGDRRGAYKTIYDTFVESAMTPAHREFLQSLVGSLDEQLRQGLGEGRGLEPQAVAKLIDGGPYTAPEAQSLGLVDRLSYWYDTAAEMRDLAGEDGAHGRPSRLRRGDRACGRRACGRPGARHRPDPARQQRAEPARRLGDGRRYAWRARLPMRSTMPTSRRSCSGSARAAAPPWPRTPSAARCGARSSRASP